MQPWFVAFAERTADGDPFYMACSDCEEVALPPRTVCPDCGTETLDRQPLSGTARVTSFTEITNTIPRFADETPYTVVLGTFDEGVRLTGQLRHANEIAVGDSVELGAEQREEGWILTFSPP